MTDADATVRFEVILAVAARRDAQGLLKPETRWIRAFAMCGRLFRAEGKLPEAQAAESIAWSLVSWLSYGRRPARCKRLA